MSDIQWKVTHNQCTILLADMEDQSLGGLGTKFKVILDWLFNKLHRISVSQDSSTCSAIRFLFLHYMDSYNYFILLSQDYKIIILSSQDQSGYLMIMRYIDALS